MKIDFRTSDIGPRTIAPAASGAAPRVGDTASAPPAGNAAPAPRGGDAAPAPPLRFDLPRSLLRQLVLAAAGYVAVMGLAFRDGAGMGLILAIFAVVGLGYYGLPAILARAGNDGMPRDERRGAWGIDTASGYLPGGAAFAQIMTVPLLMLAWAIIVAAIR